ncbi:MAG: cobalt ECF transporter T component CbiQ [Calditrichaeota bacterium]|nr:cobalt ECF transporter T component CbiQ [Calditrichota bacterium]
MHIEPDKYAHINSPVHHWDTRFKIVSLVGLIVGFSFIHKMALLPFILIISFLLIYLSRLPVRYLMKRLEYIIPFLLFAAILLSVTSGGETLYSFKMLKVYKEGLALGSVIFIRSIASILIFFVLLETAPFLQTMKALQALKIPSKLTGLVFFTYRYIYVYLEELRKMRIALRLRGYNDNSVLHTLKTNSAIIGSLLLRSLEQAERICTAMVLRGYSGNVQENSSFSARTSDYVKSLITFVIVLVIILIQKTML